MDPKKLAPVCWTYLLSSLGKLLLLLRGSRTKEENRARSVLIDLWLVTRGARGNSWNSFPGDEGPKPCHLTHRAGLDSLLKMQSEH